MLEAFIAGGWGMYPTLFAGLALLGTTIQYAINPQSRYVPLMICLGFFTLFAGVLGFVTGVMTSLRAYAAGPLASEGPTVLYLGTFESLHNVALALLLIQISTLAASIGAWRLSRQAQAAAAVPTR
jgi:hypothetical protein